jgi:hypothetical protein
MPMFRLRMPSTTERLRLPAALLLACLFVPAANAQAPSPSYPAPDRTDRSLPDQNQSPSIPEQKLAAAATALQQVAGLKRDYEQRLQSATSEPDKARIVQEANSALAKVVTDQGLSVDEYTAIMVIAQNDPQVREKILQRLPQSDSPAAK